MSRNRLGERWTSIADRRRRHRRLGVADRRSATSRSRPRSGSTSWQNDVDAAAGRAVARRSSGARSTSRPTSDFAVTAAQHQFGDRRLPAALRRVRAAGEPAPRRFEPVRRQDDRRHRVRLRSSPAWRVTAGYSTGFKAPSFNDLYFPGLLQSGPRARDVAQRRGGARTGRRRTATCAGRRARSATTTGSTTSSCSSATPTSTACRRTSIARRSKGVTLGLDATLARHARARLARPAAARGRSHRQPAAAARARSTARCRCCSRWGRCSSASRSSRRRCATTTRRTRVKMGGYGIVNLTRRMGVRERLVAVRARQQRVRQELRARRGLLDRRRAGVRRRALAAVSALARRAGAGAASRRRGARAVSVVDDTGATVTLPRPAQRIVSLAPHATELLFAAGAGVALVGCGRAQRLAAARRARCRASATRPRSTSSASSRSRPISSSRGRTRRRRRSRRCARGHAGVHDAIRARSTASPTTSSGSARSPATRGAAPPCRDCAANALARARARSTRRRAHGARVLRGLGRAAVHDRRDTLISQAIGVCGGENVFASLALPAPLVSVEAVLAARPGGDRRRHRGRRAVRAWLDDWQRWPALPAVRDGNLYVVDANLLHRPGPRFVDGVASSCARRSIAHERANRARPIIRLPSLLTARTRHAMNKAFTRETDDDATTTTRPRARRCCPRARATT